MMSNYMLVLSHTTCVNLIYPNELIRMEAISNYSKLYFINGKTLVVAKVLKWFEDKLEKEGFVRIHRSHLINRMVVTNISGASVQLYNQIWISASKRKRKYCLQLLHSRPAA